ncbi:MAG: hypothetical protein HY290_22985 [Planctomycetia bacterium]|nr:hypothetical protein [Planctomycetia bacterium]
METIRGKTTMLPNAGWRLRNPCRTITLCLAGLLVMSFAGCTGNEAGSNAGAPSTFSKSTAGAAAAGRNPDGKTLASAHDKGDVKLWDLPEATLRVALPGHESRSRLFSLAFSPDGTTLVSADVAGTIKLWDVAGRKEVASLAEAGFSVYSVAFSPDGQRLAAGGGRYDHEAKKWESAGVTIWDMPTRKIVLSINGHATAVRAVQFGGDGKWLASAGGSGIGLGTDQPGELRIWDPVDGTQRFHFNNDSGFNCLALSHDGKYLAAGCDDPRARIWDVSGLALRKRLEP